VGLVVLSKASGMMILAAATLYGVGKTYLWPTMLGIVAERFPRGGALSLNATSAVGMMSVGVVGTVFLGLIQDTAIEGQLAQEQPALHEQVVAEKHSVLGSYQAVDPARIEDLGVEDKATIEALTESASKEALATIAIFPISMMVGYVVLFILFRRRGGYRAVHLEAEAKSGADGRNRDHEHRGG